MGDEHMNRLRLRCNNKYKCHSISWACKMTKLFKLQKLNLYVTPPISNKLQFHHAWGSGIETYTFLLSCFVSSHYLGMIGISFLLSKTFAIGIILCLGTQIYLGPLMLVLNALDVTFLGKSLHLDDI